MNHIGRNIKGLALKKIAASSDQLDISAKTLNVYQRIV